MAPRAARSCVPTHAGCGASATARTRPRAGPGRAARAAAPPAACRLGGCTAQRRSAFRRPAATSRTAGLVRRGRREGDDACRSSSGGRSTAPVRACSAASTQRALLAAQLTTSALAVGGAALLFPAAPPVPTVTPVPPFFKCNPTHRQDTQKTTPRPCAPDRPSFAEPHRRPLAIASRLHLAARFWHKSYLNAQHQRQHCTRSPRLCCYVFCCCTQNTHQEKCDPRPTG